MNIAEQEFPFPAEHASNVFGQFDANMKKIEKTLHVTIIFRDDKLKLIGGCLLYTSPSPRDVP